MVASFSVGFTYGYSRCPASRDASHSAGIVESSYYLSPYGQMARDLPPCLPNLACRAGRFFTPLTSRLRLAKEGNSLLPDNGAWQGAGQGGGDHACPLIG